MTSATPLTAAETFALILDNLLRHFSTHSHRKGMPAALAILIWSRIARLRRRFADIVARLQAGTLRPPRKRAPRTSKAPSKPRPLPGSYGWLIRMVPNTGI